MLSAKVDRMASEIQAMKYSQEAMKAALETVNERQVQSIQEVMGVLRCLKEILETTIFEQQADTPRVSQMD